MECGARSRKSLPDQGRGPYIRRGDEFEGGRRSCKLDVRTAAPCSRAIDRVSSFVHTAVSRFRCPSPVPASAPQVPRAPRLLEPSHGRPADMADLARPEASPRPQVPLRQEVPPVRRRDPDSARHREVVTAPHREVVTAVHRAVALARLLPAPASHRAVRRSVSPPLGSAARRSDGSRVSSRRGDSRSSPPRCSGRQSNPTQTGSMGCSSPG